MHQDVKCRTVRNPPMSLYYKSDGTLGLHIRGGPTECPTSTADLITKYFNFGEIITGKWYDIVIHIRVDYTAKGFLHVWVDGKKHVEENSISTCYHESGAYWAEYTYLKFGLYTWSWQTQYYQDTRPDPDRIVVYYDDIRLGGISCTYEDIVTREEKVLIPKSPELRVIGKE
jgi:hypothetical protein